MTLVTTSQLRQHLHAYLQLAGKGEEVHIVCRGRTVAVLSAAEDRRSAAHTRLEELRRKDQVGDVISPVADAWEADNAAA